MARKNAKAHGRRRPARHVDAVASVKPRTNYEELARDLVTRGLASKMILDEPPREWVPRHNPTKSKEK